MTDQPKWTPGPWKVFRTTDGQKIIGIGDAEGGGVTDPHFGLWRSGKEQSANACLIAAAPCLYAALEEANRLLGGIPAARSNPKVADAITANRRALSKARGETK